MTQPMSNTPTEQRSEMRTDKELCESPHGINTDKWDIDPHPLSACADLIEMGSLPTPSFLQVLMSEEW